MIPLFKTLSFDSDIQNIQSVISRGNYWACGQEIEKLEYQISSFVWKRYAVVFNSWTSALTALFQAHDVRGKEVICPSFTFIATANAILLSGWKPVFAESENETFWLDAEDVEKRITNNTKAIITIHYGWVPARDTLKLKKLAQERWLLFIEDAAQSLWAQIGNEKVGSFGNSSIFSFCQNKIITTWEWGVALCDDKEIYEKLLLIRSHWRVEIHGCDYFSNVWDNDYIIAGNNWRMPSMNAALGLSQFSHLDDIIKKRIKIWRFYDEKFSWIVYAPSMHWFDWFLNIYQMYTLLVENISIRNALQKHLEIKWIASKVYFNPVHQKILYKEYDVHLPISENLSERVITIPCFPSLEDEDLHHITNTFINFIKK